MRDNMCHACAKKHEKERRGVYLTCNEALDRKSEQYSAAEHDPGKVHQVVIPAIVFHEIALYIRREGGIADDPKGRGNQKRRKEGPVCHHVPFLLGRPLDRAVN